MFSVTEYWVIVSDIGILRCVEGMKDFKIVKNDIALYTFASRQSKDTHTFVCG